MELLQLLSFGDTGWGDELLGGLGVTLALAIATVPFTLVLSFLVAWGKVSRWSVIRVFSNVYTTVFRSLPELLTLIIIYYQLQSVINIVADFIVPGAKISLNAFSAGVVALTLVFSALGSEVVRSAYKAVGSGQREAAAALGLSRNQVFFKVMLPQMWRHCLPAFGNLWLILLKDTSLVSIIAISDLVRYANMAIATTKEPFFFYSVLAVVYIILAFVSGQVQSYLEYKATNKIQSGR